jgi:hypothetical protein
MFSPAAEQELRELSRSGSFRRDMDTLRRGRLHAFVKDGTVDIDAYLLFVAEFNEFVGHEPKTFRRIVDLDMRL